MIPIDNLRDYQAPIDMVAKRVPKEMFEKVYKIHLPENFTPNELLQIFSGYKGYVTGRGLPDEGKAARIILKDYNNGKVLFVHLRPDYDSEKHGEIIQTNVKYALQTEDHDNLEESKDDGHIDDTVTEMSEVSEATTFKAGDASDLPRTLKNREELDFDKKYFEGPKAQKLNKAQKRAMKFAVKKGQDPNSVDLENPVFQKGRGLREVGGYTNKERSGINSNKFSHFSQMEMQ